MTYFIPAENEEYAPRDIQARVQIEPTYLDGPPHFGAPPASLNALVFNVDWRTMSPTEAGPWDSPAAATVSFTVVPRDVLARGLDPSRSDYSPHKMFANSAIVGQEFGLARRINNRQSRAGGPIDELYTLENGKFDFLIDCHDPGNEARRTCAMHSLIKPSGDLARSQFVLEASVVFHRSALGQWREIQANVRKFVADRTAFVPFRRVR